MDTLGTEFECVDGLGGTRPVRQGIGEFQRGKLERRGDVHALAALVDEPLDGLDEIFVGRQQFVVLERVTELTRERRVQNGGLRLGYRIADDGVAIGHRGLLRVRKGTKDTVRISRCKPALYFTELNFILMLRLLE